jgi:hypothetical protein
MIVEGHAVDKNIIKIDSNKIDVEMALKI